MSNPYKPNPLSGRSYQEVLSDWRFAADELENLIRACSQEPFVLALNGAWGTGKTTFLTAFKDRLKNSESPLRVVHFNAWNEDHAQDPRVSLLGELIEILPSNESGNQGPRNALVKRVGAYAKVGTPIVLKALARKAIGLKDEELEEISEEAAGDLISELFKEAVTRHGEAKASFQALKHAIANAAASGPLPLVFIIDELDRCRPTYAIELLETVKHLFDTAGVFFLLGVDISQLRHAVGTVYGRGMDTSGYLRRFIDLEYAFYPPRHTQIVTAYHKSFSGDPSFRNIGETLIELADLWSLSARDINRFFIHLRVVRGQTPRVGVGDTILAAMLFLKLYEPELFRKIVDKQADGAALLDIFNHSQRRSFLYSRAGIRFEAVIRSAMDDQEMLQESIYQQHFALQPPGIKEDALKARAEEVWQSASAYCQGNEALRAISQLEVVTGRFDTL